MYVLILRKVMRRTHVIKKFVLNLSDKAFNQFGAIRVEGKKFKFEAFHEGRPFQLRVHFRAKGYKKPVIPNSSWKPFVDKNELVMGDAVEFWKNLENNVVTVEIVKRNIDLNLPPPCSYDETEEDGE